MKRKISVVDISSDEDEDLREAIKLSKSQNGKLRQNFDGKGFFLNKLNDQYPNHSTVNIQEIIDVENLKSFSFSTYSLEMEFLNQLIPPKKEIPITICKHWAPPDSQGNFLLKDKLICVCHPKIEPYGSVHSKIWFLEFDGFLRITITSGNMTSADWTAYVQVVWVQDFPAIPTTSSGIQTNEFKETLIDFWKQCTNNLNTQWLNKYDFSKATVDLIPSVPGYHKSGNKDKYGHMRLRSLLGKYNVTSSKSVYYQSSSVGTIHENWLNSVLESFKCKKSNFNFLYPSTLTVNRSKLGIFGAGMCFLSQKTYETKSFPRENLTHFQPLTSKNYLLPHSKIIANVEIKDDKLFTWVMIGSHNFSGAALGKLQKNDSQLYIMNYELSVFFKPQFHYNVSKISNDVLPKELPIPFIIPPKRYESGDIPLVEKSTI